MKASQITIQNLEKYRPLWEGLKLICGSTVVLRLIVGQQTISISPSKEQRPTADRAV